MTLDRQYMQMINVAGLADAIDVTDDGSLLYDANNELRELTQAGTTRMIWSCRTPSARASSATRTRSTRTQPTTRC